MNLTDLVQDWDQWRALVNIAIKLGFHKILSISSGAAQLADSQEGFSSTK
jgi:hypothetical protein